MPLHLKKSVKAGPFRFNFSKSGVGVSMGVKGLRVGSGPRGHYVTAGLGGIRYRASSPRSKPSKRQLPAPDLTPAPASGRSSAVEMIEIESANVQNMREGAFSEVLDDLNKKARQIRMSKFLAWTLGIAGILVMPILSALVGWLLGRWIDSFRRTVVLYYDLEEEMEGRYRAVVAGFDSLIRCDSKWHIESGGSIKDQITRKQNAGATHLVRKKPTKLGYRSPKVIRSNIIPPALNVGKQTIYFYPDVVLIEDRKSFGAVAYSDLIISRRASNFIEADRVPKDATIIGKTWQYPNKSGGPDKRYKDNRQIPICEYEAIHFQSASGLNEIVEFSKAGIGAEFSNALSSLANR